MGNRQIDPAFPKGNIGRILHGSVPDMALIFSIYFNARTSARGTCWRVAMASQSRLSMAVTSEGTIKITKQWTEPKPSGRSASSRSFMRGLATDGTQMRPLTGGRIRQNKNRESVGIYNDGTLGVWPPEGDYRRL